MLRSAGDIPAGPQGHMDSATADLRTDGPDVACLGTACPPPPSQLWEDGMDPIGPGEEPAFISGSLHPKMATGHVPSPFPHATWSGQELLPVDRTVCDISVLRGASETAGFSQTQSGRSPNVHC